MKKNVFFIFILAAFIWSCSTTETPKTTVLYYYTPYNYAPEFLNGQVKSVKESTYWVTENDGKLEKGALVTTKEKQAARFTLDFIAHFDVDGNISQVKYLLDDNKYNSWDIESLDGKMVKASFTRDDTLRSYQKIEYHDIGETITSYRMPEETHYRTYKATINEAGIVTKLEVYNADNEKIGYSLSELNENNRVMHFKRFNPKDSLLSQTKMTYGDNGFYDTLRSFDGNGEVNWDGEFEYLSYDEKGNWTSTKTVHDGELKFIIEREYEYY